MIHIAIDGPAGSGKSTLAKMIAKEVGLNYLDSGALYRTIGYYFVTKEMPVTDAETVKKYLHEIEISLEDGFYYLNGEKITEQIRKPESGKIASDVSKIPEVREKVNEILRKISAINSTIIDGRDIGTVVLPDAEVKIYLTATSEERAQRRYKELIEKGETVNYEEILKGIIARDEADMKRAIAPLKPADDAIEVDTTDKNIVQVYEELMGIVKEKL